MSALAMAMYLTGAGAVSLDDAQRRRPPPPPGSVPILVAPPPPPYPRPAPPPLPPGVRVLTPQRARANLGSYFSSDDYPAAALRAGEQGTSSFQLTIGPNGRVTDCVITVSSGSASLDLAACRIMRSRARYTPARDSDGNPTTGSDSGRVTWRLPADMEIPVERRAGIPAPVTPAVARARLQSLVSARDYPAAALRAGAEGVSSIRMVIGMTGRVIACDVNESSGSVALDAAACRIARARALFTAARSGAGGFVCDVAFDEIEWLLPPRRAGRGAARAALAPPPIEGQLAPGVCPGRTP